VNPTGRFANRAADYVAGRPSYPGAAIDALFEGLGDPREMLVADIGAGTGISSRLLAAHGAQVIAIEPNAKMREAAEPAVTGIEWRGTTGEATGLEEASVDLVTAFQAFHWLEAHAALREFVRILRPGGRAAVVYNERDESEPFTAAYGAIVRRYAEDDTEKRRADALAAFRAFDGWHSPRRLTFRHDHILDRDGVIARARSSSYLPKDNPKGDLLRAELDDLIARSVCDGKVTMAIETIVVTGDVGGDGA
jgi:SAM-dependent methyltransferase